MKLFLEQANSALHGNTQRIGTVTRISVVKYLYAIFISVITRNAQNDNKRSHIFFNFNSSIALTVVLR